jgi:phosphoglycolate phosphatase
MGNKYATQLLVLDLDNTLYDWVKYFTTSFYAMVDVVVEILGCERDTLLDDLREVHQKHHDSEHPFALLETKVVRNLFSDLTSRERLERLDPAFHAFNKTRKQSLSLYPGVLDTLKELKGNGVIFAAYTESKIFSVLDRVERLELTDLLTRIYCRDSDSIHPNPKSAIAWGKKIQKYNVHKLHKETRKPDPFILKSLIKDFGFSLDRSAYVGDSVTRDITMAARAGVTSIWAKYGAKIHTNDYTSLVRVSHWTEEEIKREKSLSVEAKNVVPDIVLQASFTELIEKLP